MGQGKKRRQPQKTPSVAANLARDVVAQSQHYLRVWGGPACQPAEHVRQLAELVEPSVTQLVVQLRAERRKVDAQRVWDHFRALAKRLDNVPKEWGLDVDGSLSGDVGIPFPQWFRFLRQFQCEHATPGAAGTVATPVIPVPVYDPVRRKLVTGLAKPVIIGPRSKNMHQLLSIVFANGQSGPFKVEKLLQALWPKSQPSSAAGRESLIKRLNEELRKANKLLPSHGPKTNRKPFLRKAAQYVRRACNP